MIYYLQEMTVGSAARRVCSGPPQLVFFSVHEVLVNP
jgi:hypothetical protein